MQTHEYDRTKDEEMENDHMDFEIRNLCMKLTNVVSQTRFISMNQHSRCGALDF